MKILSRMLSKKIDPELPVGHELDDQDEALMPRADDTGRMNRSRGLDAEPPAADLSHPITQKEEEPEVAGSGWGNNDWDDGDWDDDEDWGEEDLDMEMRRRTDDKKQLVSEIRDAMISVGHLSPAPEETPVDVDLEEDQEAKVRSELQAKARSELVTPNAGNEDRILEKTENAMEEEGTSRRRSALAHLKAAAAATKADRVLRHVVSRDPSSDPEEQSPYRDDLAMVVRPHSASRPISRVVPRAVTRSPIWDQGEGDEDAALYAAAEDSVADAQPQQTVDRAFSDDFEEDFDDDFTDAAPDPEPRAPVDLSEDDFALDEEDDDFGARDAVRSAFPSSRFAQSDEESAEEPAAAFGDLDDVDEDDFSDDLAEEDEFAPRPSSAVAEAIAFANASDEELEAAEPPETEVRKKIWEMADEVAAEIGQSPEVESPNFAEVATTVSGRAGRSAGRVKTRLLGFQADEGVTKDVFNDGGAQEIGTAGLHFPAGWIVVIEGPGRGASFTLQVGVSQIGRGEEQAVRLDFGDTSISRNNHAAVAYDDEQGKFFLGHGGKSNLVRLNGMPVLSTEELSDGDEIRIGETTLKFVALCGEAFTWAEGGDAGAE